MKLSVHPTVVGCDVSLRALPRWRDRFIEQLEQGSNIARAAQRAGISVQRAYRARRTEPGFARAWTAALTRGYQDLELELVRRLREGDQLAEDGSKYDFASAIRLLSLHRDTSANASAEQGSVSAAEIRASIDRKLADIRHRLANERASQGPVE